MNKFLVNSEEEYIALFKDFELSDAEAFLNVEFAYEDGTYQSDMTREIIPYNEDQEVDMLTCRKNDDSNFPEEYPCVVLLANDDGFDRFGKLKFQMLDFVYLKDFNK